ncbi:GNAT family N-acetyltransferase [Paenibacillus sp. 1P07SE]|uniref:GNAT family N-acetyltransferase n=1 Tax=Paenibacillus sp. 1P07SE TaxID=3132209 RepID=UPI0039A4CCD3
MNWYNKLNNYFPEHEMKAPEHLQGLIEDKDIYHKDEDEHYLVLYAEFPTFLFIDYLLVTGNVRGKGIGTQLLNRYKAKGKMILLEAEPPDEEDADTCRRMQFYERNGFRHADQIIYEREDGEGNPFEMHILYWYPEEARYTQKQVMEHMAEACREIHNFRAKRYYGKQQVVVPEEVLSWQSTTKTKS